MTYYVAEILNLRKQFAEAFHDNEFDEAIEYGEKIIKLYREYDDCKCREYELDLCNLAVAFDEAKEYEKAIRLYKEILNIKKDNEGIFSASYAEILISVANIYSNVFRYNKALKFYENAYKIRKDILGEENEGTIQALYLLGNAYMDIYDDDNAKKCFETCIAFYSKNEPSIQLADCYVGIAKAYDNNQEYVKAKDLYQKALKCYKKLKSVESVDYIHCLTDLSAIYYTIKDYKENINCLKNITTLRAGVSGSSFDTIETLHNLADSYRLSFYFDEAISAQKQLIAFVEKLLSKKHPYYNEAISDLAFIYASAGDKDSALETFAALEALPQPKTQNKLLALFENNNDLGELYYELGEYDNACNAYSESLFKRREKLGKNNVMLVEELQLLAMCYTKNRQFNKAYELQHEALSILERFGHKSQEYVSAVSFMIEICLNIDEKKANDYMEIYLKKGKEAYCFDKFNLYSMKCTYAYYKAEVKDYDTAYNFIKDTYNEIGDTLKSGDLCDILAKIGALLVRIENYSFALKIYERLLIKSIEVFGNASDVYADYLDDYSVCLNCLNRCEHAIIINEKSLAIRRNIYNENSFPVAQALFFKGINEYRIKRFKKAIETLETAQVILDVICYENSSLYGDILYNIGLCYNEMEMYENALETFKLSYNHKNKSYGEDSLDAILCQASIANSYMLLNHYLSAITNFKKCIEALEFSNNAQEDLYIEVMHLCGKAYIKLNEFEKARTMLANAVIKNEQLNNIYDDSYGDLLYDLAYINYLQENYTIASSFFKRSIKELQETNLINDLYINSIYYLAQCSKIRGLYGEYEKLLKTIINESEGIDTADLDFPLDEIYTELSELETRKNKSIFTRLFKKIKCIWTQK